MGTHYQSMTTPRTWGSEVVQAHSAWNLEAHHVVSKDWLQLPQMITEASPTRGASTCVALAAKNGS